MGVVSPKTSLAKVHHAPTEAGYHRSWYPVCLASELTASSLVGRDILGTRVVAYRDPAGKPVVQSAWCPHLGADLSLGEIVEGRLRCPYHHWSFDGTGACAHIPTGDKIPSAARILSYPAAEAWGVVWAFNGEQPDFGLPRIPDAEEDTIAFEAHERARAPFDTWIAVSNGVHFQHLRTLHGLPSVGLPEVGAMVDRLNAEDLPVLKSIRFRHGLLTASDRHLARYFKYVEEFPSFLPPEC